MSSSESESEFTHLDNITTKPTSYKNLNSSQVSSKNSSSSYSLHEIYLKSSKDDPDVLGNFTPITDKSYYVVLYNTKPHIITSTQAEAEDFVRDNTEEIFNSIKQSYINTYTSVQITPIDNGYEIMEYNPYLPFFYDNIILCITYHKVNLFKK